MRRLVPGAEGKRFHLGYTWIIYVLCSCRNDLIVKAIIYTLLENKG